MAQIARQVIADALIETGALSNGETPDASLAQLALLRLQNQIDAWAADRLTLSVQQKTTFVAPSGSGTITLGPSGTVVMQRPVWINTINYIIPGSSPAVEVLMGEMDDDSFAAQTIKTLPNPLTTQWYYQTTLTSENGELFLWPQLTGNLTIVLYAPQAVDVPVSLDAIIQGPPGYAEAFMYQLALRLCTPLGRTPPPLLLDLAMKALARIKSVNVDPGLLGVDTALIPSDASGYNVYSDQTRGR